MTPAVRDVLGRLHGVQQTGRGQWKALCPAHDDRHPSLSVAEGDGGKALLHCFAGCAYPDIINALGLSGEVPAARANGRSKGAKPAAKPAAPPPARPQAKAGPPRDIVATYDYRDASGQVLFQKVRYEPKAFAIRRPRPNRPGYAWGLGGVAPVLYRLPELIDPATDWQPVYLCEGEKDADRVAGRIHVATCNFDGAGKWRADYNDLFADRVVYILADNDDMGRAHAEHVAAQLYGIAQTVKIIHLPGLPDKGDVSDWLDAGYTVGDLEHVCLMTPGWQPPPGWQPQPDDGADDDGAGVADDAIAFQPDDTGNAERFVARHGDDVRYDHSTGAWLIWAGTHWRRDDDGEVQRLAKETARSIFDDVPKAAGAGHDELAVKLAKWARASAAESRRNSMLNLAQTERPIALTHDRLDTRALLLNCRNGTLDLATGALRPHDREDLLTCVLPVEYDPAAVAPTWDAFLRRITNGDGDLAAFLARAAGYTLSGSTAEQCLFFLYGHGANGKSTFIETILALLGDLGHKARAQVLMQDERGRVPNEIAALAGKRLVVASELADGGRLNEGMVKDLTGSDTMSARFLYGEPFTFRPAFKLWLYGNHKPVITGTDDGIWRRVRLIPFAVQIAEEERDPGLPDKLRAELPGILAWAVRGWRDYQTHGLRTPAVVATATAEYRADSDTLGLFLAERCVTGVDKSAGATDLYNAYTEWATVNGLRALSNVRFGRALGGRDFAKERTTGGRWTYRGIGLLADHA